MRPGDEQRQDLGRADDEGPDIALPRPADPTQAHVRIRPHVRLGGRGVTGVVSPPRKAGGHKFPLLIRDGAAQHPKGKRCVLTQPGPGVAGAVYVSFALVWVPGMDSQYGEDPGMDSQYGEDQDALRASGGQVRECDPTAPDDRQGGEQHNPGVGPDGRIVVEWHSNGERMLLTVDKRPGFGLIRGGSDLSLRAEARDLKTYGGRIQYSRTRIGGTLAILVLRAFNG